MTILRFSLSKFSLSKFALTLLAFCLLLLGAIGGAGAQTTITSQNWDSVTAPSAAFSGWNLTNAQTITTSPVSSPNALIMSGGALASGYYNTLDGQSGNVTVSAYQQITVNSTGEIACWVFARSSAASGSYTSGTSYAVILDIGGTSPGLYLQKRLSGAVTVLGSPVPVASFSRGAWYRVILTLNGTALSVSCQRLSDSLWVTASGSWQSPKVVCASATDSSITGQGYSGVALYGQTSAETDNFLLQSLGGTLQSPTLTGTNVSTSNSLTATANGGTAPYTYTFYRSTASGFTPGAGNQVQSGSLSTLSDTGLASNTPYYYVVSVTDSAATPATSASSQLALTTTRPAGTFYFSSAGSDGNTGTLAAPWLTLAHSPAAGDTYLLRGGDTFAGPLAVSGISGLTVGAYGTGIPTITQGNGDGLTLTNCSNVSTSGLAFTSTDTGDQTVAHPSTGAAVHWVCTQASGTLTGISVSACTMVGGRIGFFVDAENPANTAPFLGWTVNGCDISRVHFGGVVTFALSGTPLGWPQGGAITSNGTFPDSGAGFFIKGGYIADCNFHDIYGNGITTARTASNAFQTGNWGTAMEFLNADTVLVERCRWDNVGYTGDGTIEEAACQAEASKNLTFRYCEGSRTRCLDGTDGGAFDVFDGGTQNNTIEYCYLHDNDGPAVEGGSTGRDGASTGHIVRYNVSVNDCRSSSAGGQQQGSIFVFGSAGTWQVYNNTIYLSGTGNTKTRHGIYIAGGLGAGSLFANNVLSVTGNSDFLGTIQSNASLPLIAGNDYWAFGGTTFGVTTATGSYTSLGAWQAVSENLAGLATGIAADPLFVNAGYDPAQVLPALPVSSVKAYDLSSSSPLRGAGQNPFSLLGINPGATDFHGRLLNMNAYDIGAIQSSAMLPYGTASGGTKRRIQ